MNACWAFFSAFPSPRMGQRAAFVCQRLTWRASVIALLLVACCFASASAQIDCVELGLDTQLKNAKAIFVGTVIEGNERSARCRLRVDESFKGARGRYVDLSPDIRPSIHFELGEQYLVFAYACPYEGAEKNCLTGTGPCSSTRRLEDARALVEQLRAEKSGKGLAPVYGTLTRTLERYMGIWEEGYERPLPDILVKLISDKKSFETRTDKYGVYSFRHLPAGRYQVSADLPPHMTLGNEIGNGPVAPIELPRRSSFMIDLYALPTGRITGKVMGPDGKPLDSAAVELYQASRYREAGLFGFQGKGTPKGEWKQFEFYHLPADDYVLVFNPANKIEAHAPFPRTFYPDASSLETAEIIHLSEGQQILDADIHISNPPKTQP